VTSDSGYDAVVVGAGPNGLAAAIEIARADRSVLVIEAAETVGGGARTSELTLPGFRHDDCSAIHPMGVASPFFRKLPLHDHGLEWVHPGFPLAHPLDDGSTALIDHSIDVTADRFGEDGPAYRRVMEPLLRDADKLLAGFLSPMTRVPRNPFVMLRLGRLAVRPATKIVDLFKTPGARALYGGNAAHAIMPLDRLPTGAFGFVYSFLAHAYGWPMPRGGSQAISDALAGYLASLGGRIECGRRITSFRELPPARAYLFDTSPRQLLDIAGDELSWSYKRKLARYKYGAAVFKIDWALDGPIPWKAPECTLAGTLHLGGTFEEIAASEAAVAAGEHPDNPWVIVAQQSLFDPTRAPSGKHTAWAYCHVPNGSTVDMTDVLERQVERFAPGFRDLVIGRSTRTAVDLERYNENYVGGDIASGEPSLRQIVFRPVARRVPYATPHPGIFICSSSTPPGPGVHGMCGYYAARAARRRFR
jgi:phytoene dehydrogenase-like protein